MITFRNYINWIFSIVLVLTLVTGCGQHEKPGTVTKSTVPENEVQNRTERQVTSQKQSFDTTITDSQSRQILFGDFHVHTTFSNDAFVFSLPIMGGTGSHPPADACDFARFCSQLDFWSINDHAEGITPRRWDEMKQSIRQCNAVSGQSKNTDLISFLGYEWTQKGMIPSEHYGHKNVIFKNTSDTKVPDRPISSANPHEVNPDIKSWQKLLLQSGANFAVSPRTRDRIGDLTTYMSEIHDVKVCPKNVNTENLSDNCIEVAETPRVLFRKLNEWDYKTVVIPHGTTWGIYTPPGSSWDKQLNEKQHDPNLQKLIEIYSGHGNSEAYRDFRAVKYDKNGKKYCPKPTDNYLPCCWRAGEIIRDRCDDSDSVKCEKRVKEARKNFLKFGSAGHLSVPGTHPDDWKNCGQCQDCFNPAFKYRPRNSVQYILALSEFRDTKNPMRFTLGFIGSSDNHQARPGTGYKEFGRTSDMTETYGLQSKPLKEIARPQIMPGPDTPLKHSFSPDELNVSSYFQRTEFERQNSFWMTGGLAAVHASERNRDSVWKAVQNRHVYGTSGDRILLWFNSINNGEQHPMGSQISLAEDPRFRVKALGAFKQKDGCPKFVENALGNKRTMSLCGGECYYPSNERHDLKKIEVVRIQPQSSPDEPIKELIEDPWKTFECPDDSSSCTAEFTDPEFSNTNRETVYYVRAIQESTPAVNAGGMRCEYNDDGECVEVNQCYGDYRSDPNNDCLSPNRERAWSSPIYVTPSE